MSAMIRENCESSQRSLSDYELQNCANHCLLCQQIGNVNLIFVTKNGHVRCVAKVSFSEQTF